MSVDKQPSIEIKDEGVRVATAAQVLDIKGANVTATTDPVTGAVEIDITVGGLTTGDVDDTPVDGATTAPVSSNWAYDHAAATTAVHGVGAGTVAKVSDIAATKIDALTAGDDNTTLDSNTTRHGLLIKAVAPAASLLNVPGIVNGESVFTNKPVFDATNPAALGSVAPGTAVTAAHRDHVHANPAIDTLAAATDIATLDTSTTAHGLAPKAVAPATGLVNVLGIAYGETAITNKALFDATAPSTQAFADAAAAGTAVASARRDHKHAMMANPVTGHESTYTHANIHAANADTDLDSTFEATFEKVANKAAASGYASLSAGSLVVQNPANATATPTASKIVIADASAKVDGWVSAASLTVPGIVELATLAEINTGTDTGRAMPVDQFVASNRNVRYILIRVLDPATSQTVLATVGGDFEVPFTGTITEIGAYVDTAGVTGSATYDVHLNGTTIMTTTKITVETTEKSSRTAANAPALTTTAVTTGDIITVDIDAIQTTAAKGLTLRLGIRQS